MLLWLWYRPVATASIQALAWEPPYAEDAALEGQKGGGWFSMLRFIFIYLFIYAFFFFFFF